MAWDVFYNFLEILALFANQRKRFYNLFSPKLTGAPRSKTLEATTFSEGLGFRNKASSVIFLSIHSVVITIRLKSLTFWPPKITIFVFHNMYISYK